MHRRLLATAPAAVAAALALASPLRARAASPRGLWFDPTQLPAYSGRVARWLLHAGGEVDRGQFREGTQFVFPPSEADALMRSVELGGALTVWGIRARAAPVVTMLAWARAEADPAIFVERPTWFAREARGAERLALAGKVAAPLLSPQGEPMGVILDSGSVIQLPAALHARLAARLEPGKEVAAAGPGSRRGELAAIDAEQLGASAATLATLAEIMQ